MSTELSHDELLRLAFDEAPLATIVTSPDWRVLHWGLTAEQLFGWTAQEAVGQALDRLTGPDGGLPDRRLLDIAAVKPEGSREIVMRRHKDGRLMHVEVSWRTVRSATGAMRFQVASKRDVSGEQLRRDVNLVNERYRDLLDSVPDAIVIANDVGSIVLFNSEAARLFGVAPDSMLGAPVERLIPDRFARGHSRHRERFASQPQRRPMGSGLELHARRGNGTEFPVEVSLSPLVLGERRFAMAALRDLSERVRLEEVQAAADTARKASSAKTEFLSRMSHELRTPLNAILGFAQVLSIDATQRLDETQQRQITQIMRAGRHLLAMMNDLLDVTRIETGALSLSLESVEVLATVDEVLAICEPAAAEAAVTLAFAVDPIDLCVRADRLRLRQVLLNLVTNGIKYNRRGGRVDVTVARAGNEASIAVHDTGVGMSTDQLARLYRPFDRLGAEAAGVEGTGIGLVIARGLAQGMGGRLEVASKPGSGSTFSIHLPVAGSASLVPESSALGVESLPTMTPGQAEGQTQTQTPAPAPDATRLRLLYVEDNEANVEVMRAVMALRPQWRLDIACTGEQALDQSIRARPDLMVVDMHLPDTTGLELARRWDAEPATADIPRAALSADATELRMRTAIEGGFFQYFTKPIDVPAFLAWLDTFEREQAAS
jgi:PAS domain S-box-containing protein